MRAYKILLLLFICILAMPIIFFLIPSSINDVKEPMPTPTVNALGNREYQKTVDDALADRIVGHNAFVQLKTWLNLAMGQKESNGIYIADNMLIQKPSLPSPEAVEKITKNINAFAQTTSVPKYVLIIPSSAEINQTSLPTYAPKLNELDFINDIYACLLPDIIRLDAATPLSSSKDAQVFYHTDSQLTSFGAFSIYNYNIKSMGFVPASYSDFNIEYAPCDYYGKLYQQTPYAGVKADRVDLYHYNAAKINTTVQKYDEKKVTINNDLYYKEYLNTDEGVYVFLGEPAPLTSIKTNVENGKKLLVFGDENIGTLSQFFSIHYAQIDIVDLSSLTPNIAGTIDINNYDEILFATSTTALNDENMFENLSMLTNKGGNT